MKAAFKAIDYLFNNPTTINLALLNKLFMVGIPFNVPHGFKIKNVNDEFVQIDLPNRKLNHNHLGGIHACAIATLGEFCAGLGILKFFKISEYRLIMSELNVRFSYQAKDKLTGRCDLQFDPEQIQKDLDESGKSTQIMKTIIRDREGQEVAVVTTTWQIKKWNLVKTKLQ